jgi:hypothetical protein
MNLIAVDLIEFISKKKLAFPFLLSSSRCTACKPFLQVIYHIIVQDMVPKHSLLPHDIPLLHR